MNSKICAYLLITPARNEEGSIEKTIQSMIFQTVLPVRWVIVSDGSTDRTDEIVKRYITQYQWIELIRMPEHRDRQFAAKVQCINAGYERVKGIEYEIIGCLDADISFEKDYLEFLLGKFVEMPELGVAGTPFVEESGEIYNYEFTNIEHVSGACQLFRRKCFEDIGGYLPIQSGGIDWVAVTTARMRGWQTRTFTEKVCFHHRKMGSANSGALLTWVRHGREDYYLGNHPLWQIFRSLYQMTRKPYIIGGAFLFFGYCYALMRRVEIPISPELMSFHRNEQMMRLQAIFLKALRRTVRI